MDKRTNDPQGYVEDRLDQIRRGRGGSAFYSLFYCDLEQLRVLIQALDEPKNEGIRPLIVHCIWQNREPETVVFLASLMNDPDAEVWKEALDGLVAIGGTESLDVLQAARRQTAPDDPRLEWIDEALSQIRTSFM